MPTRSHLSNYNVFATLLCYIMKLLIERHEIEIIDRETLFISIIPHCVNPGLNIAFLALWHYYTIIFIFQLQKKLQWPVWRTGSCVWSKHRNGKRLVKGLMCSSQKNPQWHWSGLHFSATGKKRLHWHQETRHQASSQASCLVEGVYDKDQDPCWILTVSKC